MFTEKDILARLQAGEDVQKIADEMAANLNQANKAYVEQKAAEEAQAKQNDIQKKQDLQDIIDQLHAWLGLYYPSDNLDEMFEELTADTVLELIAAIEEYAKAMQDLKSIFDIKPAAPKIKPAVKAPKTQNPDDVLSAFLKEMNW